MTGLRVRSALDPARPVNAHAAALAGLAVACGLRYLLDQYQPQGGRTIQDAVATVGPGLQELISQTQTAVDSAVLAFILAGVAPLTVAAGPIPTAYGVTRLTGIPAAFLGVAVILGVFATGYMAMSCSIVNAGAFYKAHMFA